MNKVTLISYTPEMDKIIASAAKLCYSDANVEDLMKGLTESNINSFIEKLLILGHESPFEHCTFTFAIEEVSRSLTHQLVRHRIASYSQQSQRYVKLDQFEYVIPPEIAKDPSLNSIFIRQMKTSQETYDCLIEGLIANGRTEKQAIEDARYVFPNACTSKIIVTMNIRSLWNFFRHRCCNRAQWEIKQLADEMLKECKKVSPILFLKAGAACVEGFCPENKMQCQQMKGKIYTKDEAIEILKAKR